MTEDLGVLTVGEKAPGFTLPSSSGQYVRLGDYLRKNRVVLYFYPKADTPGCTKEACRFRDAIASYKKLDVSVFGISPDPIEAVYKFADKYKINFPLLADQNQVTSKKYGVWREKNMYGKKYWGVARTTFVIGTDGKIEKVFERVKPEGHDQQVLAYLRGK
jgi:peroxiredoxin Q/BCP